MKKEPKIFLKYFKIYFLFFYLKVLIQIVHIFVQKEKVRTIFCAVRVDRSYLIA